MNIYTVEIHGRLNSYIGIQESTSEYHAAMRAAAEIIDAHLELPHDIRPGIITKHPGMERAVAWYKQKYQDHELIDPWQDFILNEEEE